MYRGSFGTLNFLPLETKPEQHCSFYLHDNPYCCLLLLQPPVLHPPAGILPFLDVESIKDTGFRLARLTREDCSFMGADCVIAKVRPDR